MLQLMTINQFLKPVYLSYVNYSQYYYLYKQYIGCYLKNKNIYNSTAIILVLYICQCFSCCFSLVSKKRVQHDVGMLASLLSTSLTEQFYFRSKFEMLQQSRVLRNTSTTSWRQHCTVCPKCHPHMSFYPKQAHKTSGGTVCAVSV